MPHREIQEANTNPMAVLWVLRLIKNCCVVSQLLSGQMHRECCYYCEVSMNNIKALPGSFRGSRQLGQTIVIIGGCRLLSIILG